MGSPAYSIDGLVDAATGHEDIHLDVEDVISKLLGLGVDPAVLSRLPEAASFAQALERARDMLGRSAALDADFRGAQSIRTSTVARLG